MATRTGRGQITFIDVTDGSSLQIMYSEVAQDGDPGNPTDNPDNWQTSSVFMNGPYLRPTDPITGFSRTNSDGGPDFSGTGFYKPGTTTSASNSWNFVSAPEFGLTGFNPSGGWVTSDNTTGDVWLQIGASGGRINEIAGWIDIDSSEVTEGFTRTFPDDSTVLSVAIELLTTTPAPGTAEAVYGVQEIRMLKHPDNSSSTLTPFIKLDLSAVTIKDGTSVTFNEQGDYSGWRGTGERGPSGPNWIAQKLEDQTTWQVSAFGVGANGQSTDIYLAYANDASGSTAFSTTYFTDALYQGTDVISWTEPASKPSQSTTAADYIWTRIRGENGNNGSNSNIRVDFAYADNITGTSGFSTTDSTKKFRGTNAVSWLDTATEPSISTNPADYEWAQWTGDNGGNGDNGQSTDLYRAYANSSDGSTDFSTTYFTDALYEGTDVITWTAPAAKPSQSTSASSYEWTRLRGENGASGSSVLVVYANSANISTNTQSLTLTSGLEYVAYYEYTGTAPNLPIRSGITFSKFVGNDGTGATGPRSISRTVYLTAAQSTQPSNPSTSGVSINFTTGVISGLPSGWQETPNQILITSSSATYWRATLQFTETTFGGSQTVTAVGSPSGRTSFGVDIQSDTYNGTGSTGSPGTAGWIIERDTGYAEFGSAVIRDQLTAGQINIGSGLMSSGSGEVIVDAGYVRGLMKSGTDLGTINVSSSSQGNFIQSYTGNVLINMATISFSNRTVSITTDDDIFIFGDAVVTAISSTLALTSTSGNIRIYGNVTETSGEISLLSSQGCVEILGNITDNNPTIIQQAVCAPFTP